MNETVELLQAMMDEGLSHTAAAERLGISRYNFWGLLEEHNFDYVPGYHYTVRGVTGTARELCEHFGISLDKLGTLRRRRHEGLTMEEAMFSPLKRRSATYTYRGFTGTLVQIVEHFKLPVNAKTIWRRIAAGMPEQEAFSTPNRVFKCQNLEAA